MHVCQGSTGSEPIIHTTCSLVIAYSLCNRETVVTPEGRDIFYDGSTIFSHVPECSRPLPRFNVLDKNNEMKIA